MLALPLLLVVASGLADALALPMEKRDDPAPLKLDFSVERKEGNLTLLLYFGKYTNLGKRGSYPVTITDDQDISYMIDVYLGLNKQKASVALDTGSSDLWVPSSEYSPLSSTTSKDTGTKFSIEYADLTTSNGEYYLDTLTFAGNSPTLKQFQFAAADGSGGVFGIGGKNTESTYPEYNNLPYALQAAGLTPKASYSLYLGPEGSTGSVIFGGIDTKKYSGTLTLYPVGTDGLSIKLASISASDGSLFTVNTNYLLDSGTSLGAASPKFMAYLDKIFPGQKVSQSGFTYRIVSCNQPTNKYLTFNFGKNSVKLSYANAVVNQGDGTCLLGFSELSDYTILGDVFLRLAYVYYDLTDSLISIAQALYSLSSNIISA